MYLLLATVLAATGVAMAASPKLTTSKRSVEIAKQRGGDSGRAPGRAVVATCRGNRKVASGGFRAKLDSSSSGSRVVVNQLSPRGATGWRARAVNVGGKPGRLTSYAYCAKRRLREGRVGVSRVAPRRSARASARCPRGTRAVVAGFRAQVDRRDLAPGIVVSGLRLRGRAAVATGANQSSKAGKLRAFALCAKVGRVRSATASATIPPEERGTAVASCPAGTRFVSGGFSAEIATPGADPTAAVTQARKVGSREWRVSAFNVASGNPAQLRSIAYCR